MDNFQRVLSSLLIVGLPLTFASTMTLAAKPLDLKNQRSLILQKWVSGIGAQSVSIKEINRSVDFKKTLHVRIQETYQGYPIWGGDGILHIPNGEALSGANLQALATQNSMTMNGIFYDELSTDLANTPSIVFTEGQADRALQAAINDYQKKVATKVKTLQPKTQLMVYIDEQHKAHWAFLVSFRVIPTKASDVPTQPMYILDAISFHPYANWNNLKTIDRQATNGGGLGGNEKMGKLVYDGLTDHLGKLNILRDGSLCYLQNKDVTVKKCTSTVWYFCLQSVESTYPCTATDPNHNGVYWNGDMDAINGAYSPSNDALFNGAIIKNMYQDWYHVPVLKTSDGKPMMLTMIVHVDMENAYWDGSTMNFGDGGQTFYPLTSLGVAAHEISHGFTEQHSNLTYNKQSGGMNEAYSDMAAQAAEYFAYGTNSWQIGPEIFRENGKALRYMDLPSKDGQSIDDASQYSDSIDVHYTSGVYNRFFYTLGTTKGWNTRKAFDVMEQANAHYWTATSTFDAGACGVIQAATDLGYSVNDVKAAFDLVKVNYSTC